MIRDAEGNPLYVCGVARDITERKRAEDALRDEREFVDTAINALQDGFYVLSVEGGGKLVRWNKMFNDVTGFSDEELSNMTVFDFFDEEGKKEQEQFFLELLEKGKAGIEVEIITIDGRRVPCHSQATMIRDAEGNPLYVCGVARDITERKAAERETVEAKEQWEKSFNAIGEAIFIIDDEYRILRHNRAFTEMVGVTGDLTGRKCYEIVHNEDHAPDSCVTCAAITDGRSCKAELFEPFLGRYLVVTADPYIDEQGRVEFVVHTARDITELERSNAELDGFAHAIAHDLKGPRASMGVAIDLIKVMGEGPVTDDTFANVGEALDTMARSVDRAMVLVDGLLALARAGQAPVEVTDVDVGRVLRSVLEEKSGVIEERRVEVKVDERLGTIRANELQVYQVFANLIVNAIKHNDSPEPAIEVRSLPADEPGEHRYLVRDNGPGIPLEDLKRVFLPFFERGKTGETGIGLATVEKIVRVYGGAIRAYNDGGACFEFTLPTRSP
jgi:PAS domain S-box-containing protein